MMVVTTLLCGSKTLVKNKTAYKIHTEETEFSRSVEDMLDWKILNTYLVIEEQTTTEKNG
jgi:hypothetical protein